MGVVAKTSNPDLSIVMMEQNGLEQICENGT